MLGWMKLFVCAYFPPMETEWDTCMYAVSCRLVRPGQLDGLSRRLAKVRLDHEAQIRLFELCLGVSISIALYMYPVEMRGLSQLTSFKPSAEFVPCRRTTTGTLRGPSSSAAPMMLSAIMTPSVIPVKEKTLLVSAR